MQWISRLHHGEGAGMLLSFLPEVQLSCRKMMLRKLQLSHFGSRVTSMTSVAGG
jgi:hypothetical protein